MFTIEIEQDLKFQLEWRIDNKELAPKLFDYINANYSIGARIVEYKDHYKFYIIVDVNNCSDYVKIIDSKIEELKSK